MIWDNIWDKKFLEDEMDRFDARCRYNIKSLKIVTKYMMRLDKLGFSIVIRDEESDVELTPEEKKRDSFTRCSDEFDGGLTHSIKIHTNGYDLTIYFIYHDLKKKSDIDIDYYVEFPSNGLTRDFVDRLNSKYKEELKYSIFGNLRLYDEEEIAEIKANREKYEQRNKSEITDIKPCIALSSRRPKPARDVKQNLAEIIGALTEKGGVVEKIRNEIENAG